MRKSVEFRPAVEGFESRCIPSDLITGYVFGGYPADISGPVDDPGSPPDYSGPVVNENVPGSQCIAVDPINPLD